MRRRAASHGNSTQSWQTGTGGHQKDRDAVKILDISPFISAVVIVHVQSFSVDSSEVDNIYVRLVDSLDVALAWVDTEWSGPVDAGHRDTIPGLDFVDEVVVSVE